MHDHVESDIGAAAFLMTRGFTLTSLERLSHSRYGFQFSDPNKTAAHETRNYFAGATAEAKTLLDALRNLKDQLYAVKGYGNGNARRQSE